MIPLPLSLTVDAQPLADILIPYLERIIAMNQAEFAVVQALGTSLNAALVQFDKATNEIIVAISNAGATTPEQQAALDNLQSVATALKTAAQALDDLNPDAP